MWNNTRNTTKGTARGKSDWPPKEIGKISIHNNQYNSLYYMNDRVGNYWFFCWIDNNIVKMVSILAHQVMSMFLETEGSHESTSLTGNTSTWFKVIGTGNNWRFHKKIKNNYNHWMLGVDVVDQLIASYQPKLWCQRTWMPIFLHCLDILRVNLYVLYKETPSNNHDNAPCKDPTIYFTQRNKW